MAKSTLAISTRGHQRPSPGNAPDEGGGWRRVYVRTHFQGRGAFEGGSAPGPQHGQADEHQRQHKHLETWSRMRIYIQSLIILSKKRKKYIVCVLLHFILQPQLVYREKSAIDAVVFSRWEPYLDVEDPVPAVVQEALEQESQEPLEGEPDAAARSQRPEVEQVPQVLLFCKATFVRLRSLSNLFHGL